MSNKAPKRPKSKKPQEMATKKIFRISPVAIVLGAATLIGGVAALLTFVPRVNVTGFDPLDLDPFSSSVTVANTGYVKLDAVRLSLSIINIKNGQKTVHGGSNYQDRVGFDGWGTHDLGLDDKFTVLLNDAIRLQDPIDGQTEADVALVVSYELPFTHWRREKIFPIYARRQKNGALIWYSHEPPN